MDEKILAPCMRNFYRLQIIEMIKDKKNCTYKSLGWFIGEKNANCDITCNAHNLVCTEDEMWKHNSDVDAPEKLANLINRLQGNTSFSTCSEKYGQGYTDVPVFSTSAGLCLNPSPRRPKNMVDCGRVPTPKNQNKQRLCYCHAGKSRYIKKVMIVRSKIINM